MGDWMSWMPVSETPEGVALTLPGRADVNHIDGVGTIYLAAHYPLQLEGGIGPLDLRGATIDITLRGENVNLRGGKLLWWLVSQLPSSEPEYPWQQSNWAYTGKPVPVSSTLETVSTVFHAEPGQWTYAGTNTTLQGFWGARYVYSPIENVLADTNATLHLVVLNGPSGKPPSGTITISEITINLPDDPQEVSEPSDGMVAVALPDYTTDVVPLLTAGDFVGAEPLLRQLADTGHRGAAFHLGMNYRYGRSGKVDLVLARKYLQIAASTEAEASVELAELYLSGLGVPRDVLAALGHLGRPKLEDWPRALRMRANICISEALPSGCDAEALLVRAAEAGSPGAIVDLGVMLARDGRPNEALDWFYRAEDYDLTDPERLVVEHNIERLHS